MRLRQLERRKRRTHAGGLFPNHDRLPPSAHDRPPRQEQLSPFLCIKNISCPRTVQYIRSAKKRFFKKMNLTSRFVFERESGRKIFGIISESHGSRLLLLVVMAQHRRKGCISVGGEDRPYLCLGASRSDQGSGVGWGLWKDPWAAWRKE